MRYKTITTYDLPPSELAGGKVLRFMKWEDAVTKAYQLGMTSQHIIKNKHKALK